MQRTQPVARKEHKCDSCGHTIEKGEMYFRDVYFPGEYDCDSMYVYKSHRFCRDICIWYHNEHDLCDDEGVSVLDSEVIYDLWKEWGVYHHLRAMEIFDHTCRRLELEKLKEQTPERQEEVKQWEIRVERARQDLPSEFAFDDEPMWDWDSQLGSKD